MFYKSHPSNFFFFSPTNNVSTAIILWFYNKKPVVAPYIKNPATKYERFVNKRWNETAHKFSENNQKFLKQVLEDWIKIKDDAEAHEKFMTT